MLLHSAAICEVAFRQEAKAPRSTGAGLASWGWAALALPRPFLPIPGAAIACKIQFNQQCTVR
jgi:hypothetical protein